MRLNRLDEQAYKRLVEDEKQREVLNFLDYAHENEKEDKFIYKLTLKSGEEVVALFETEQEVDYNDEKEIQLTFIVLKVLERKDNLKLKTNSRLVFNYTNFFKCFLLIDDDDYALKLKIQDLAKYDFSEVLNNKIEYFESLNKVVWNIYFHPWAQTEKFPLTNKDDLDIIIEFRGVSIYQNESIMDEEYWWVNNLSVNGDIVTFEYTDDNDWFDGKSELKICKIKAEEVVLKLDKPWDIDNNLKGKLMK